MNDEPRTDRAIAYRGTRDNANYDSYGHERDQERIDARNLRTLRQKLGDHWCYGEDGAPMIDRTHRKPA